MSTKLHNRAICAKNKSPTDTQKGVPCDVFNVFKFLLKKLYQHSLKLYLSRIGTPRSQFTVGICFDATVCFATWHANEKNLFALYRLSNIMFAYTSRSPNKSATVETLK